MPVPAQHFVNGHRLEAPFPAGMQLAMFGLGCFWGAERKFWNVPGVYTTQVGYAAGITPNPTYEEVCSGYTGHNEVVRVVFDPRKSSYEELLKVFWESHDPTQGMRQGNDIGTQYRSGIYCYDAEQRAAAAARRGVRRELQAAGFRRSRRKSSTRRSSTTPRTTTSSTWRRTRTDTAASAARASRARSASAFPRRRLPATADASQGGLMGGAVPGAVDSASIFNCARPFS